MITLDTNVYISALIFGGKPAELLMKAIEGETEVAISQAILDEMLRILRDKFGLFRGIRIVSLSQML